MIKKIISGGQTGTDRAALDAAIELGIPHGGWILKDRVTEDAPYTIDTRFLMSKLSLKDKSAIEIGFPLK